MSAPLPTQQPTKYDKCAHTLRALWIDGDGVITRRAFEDACLDHAIDPDVMQRVFEGLPPFRVERVRDEKGKLAACERDRFVFPIYSQASQESP